MTSVYAAPFASPTLKREWPDHAHRDRTSRPDDRRGRGDQLPSRRGHHRRRGRTRWAEDFSLFRHGAGESRRLGNFVAQVRRRCDRNDALFFGRVDRKHRPALFAPGAPSGRRFGKAISRAASTGHRRHEPLLVGRVRRADLNPAGDYPEYTGWPETAELEKRKASVIALRVPTVAGSTQGFPAGKTVAPDFIAVTAVRAGPVTDRRSGVPRGFQLPPLRPSTLFPNAGKALHGLASDRVRTRCRSASGLRRPVQQIEQLIHSQIRERDVSVRPIEGQGADECSLDRAPGRRYAGEFSRRTRSGRPSTRGGGREDECAPCNGL